LQETVKTFTGMLGSVSKSISLSEKEFDKLNDFAKKVLITEIESVTGDKIK
jgi:hypothetical protein